MTETHTGSQYLLQSIALDKPAVWLVNPNHVVRTNKKEITAQTTCQKKVCNEHRHNLNRVRKSTMKILLCEYSPPGSR